MKSLLSFAALVLLASTVIAQDAAAPEVIDATNLDGLRAKAGAEVIVEGFVTEVGTTKANTITFINIGAPKKQGFVAVVMQSAYGAFTEGFDKYKAQKVRVQGLLELYRGDQPQIKLNGPDQITIVTEGTPGAAP